MKKRYILGIDLGGTKVSAAIVDNQGNILTKEKERTEVEKGAKGVISQMIKMSEKVIRDADVTTNELLGIGIGAAGPLNAKEGIIINPPNLPGWFNVQLVKPFYEYFKLPVYLNNDANAAALGELYFGAGCGCQNMVYLTISTGIGGGIIIEGKLYQGTNDNAGEVGHMIIEPEGPLCNCGRRGCLEALASGTAIARFARQAMKEGKKSLIFNWAEGKEENIDAKLVFKAAKGGDKVAQEIVKMCTFYLGIGVANIINAFNPQRIILGGGVCKAGKLIFEPVRKVAKDRSMPALFKVVKIFPAKLKDNAGVIGAASLVLANTC